MTPFTHISALMIGHSEKSMSPSICGLIILQKTQFCGITGAENEKIVSFRINDLSDSFFTPGTQKVRPFNNRGVVLSVMSYVQKVGMKTCFRTNILAHFQQAVKRYKLSHNQPQ